MGLEQQEEKTMNTEIKTEETPKSQQPDLSTPWSLHFDRDGTEDIAIIVDADGHDLATSRPFWLPEPGDEIPPTLVAMTLMSMSRELFEALDELLAAVEEIPILMIPEKLHNARSVAHQVLTKAIWKSS
jgi:hypothetical protein